LIYYDFCAKLQKSIVSAKEKGELFFFYQRKAVPLHPNQPKYDMPQSLHIAIIGGGAAGFFAAKCSTLMPSPAASICRQPGPRGMWWDNI